MYYRERGIKVNKESYKKQKNHRFALIWIISIALLIFIFGNTRKDKIVRLVIKNQDFLNESIENETYDKIYKINAIKSITPYSLSNNELYIDFYCSGFGIAPSSTYYGFYYSSNDEPIGFQAAPIELEPDGNGWSWQQPNGDNSYYTEKILKNWYYYRAGF